LLFPFRIPFRAAVVLTLSAGLVGCGATGRPDLPLGSQMNEDFAIPDAAQAEAQLRIKAYDILSVQVYQEPGLSVSDQTVDAAGNIMMPMLGEIPALGMSPNELSRDLERRFGASLLRNPQVTVERKSGILDRVTVVGAVKKPGQFPVRGPVTLLDAISLAEGITNVARRNDVAIIRTINGRRAGAIFSLDDIEQGQADDPAILPSDRVVVGTSAIAQGYRDLLQAVPLIGLGFRYF
jgi:polysaccharide export outer membrane protein